MDLSLFTVKKFGGTSLGSTRQIDRVSGQLACAYAAGERFVVVASAMSGETNRLIALGREIHDDPPPALYDRLFASGEQAAISLLAMSLAQHGVPAQPLTGPEVPVMTEGGHMKARVHHVKSDKLHQLLSQGVIPVVAGCQGADIHTGALTTLGRGGSDTTAVAIAIALGSVTCEIYTDVEGVYSTDPRICERARLLRRMSYMAMLEMASLGARVMQIRSVELGYRYHVPIHVRSAFSWKEGTMIESQKHEPYERLCVSHVTLDENQAKIMIHGIPASPDTVPRILTPLARRKINVDMIVQSFSKDKMDMYFTVARSDYDKTLRVMQEVGDQIGATHVAGDDHVAKVSALGSGMMDHYGVASKFFDVLAQHNIPVYLTSTSEIKISVLVPKSLSVKAVDVLHKVFIDEIWDPIEAYEHDHNNQIKNVTRPNAAL